MLDRLYYVILAAFGWSISIIIEKHYLLSYFKPIELILLRGPFFILFFIYYLMKNKNFIDRLKYISWQKFIFLSFTMLSGFVALYCFFKLLSNEKSFYCVSIVHPLFIVLTILLSYFFFFYDINLYQAIGIVFVIIGIMIINLNKKKALT